ncbi:MAG TPA: hypothetical protein VHX36_11895 [Candidatus Acidoferrales bacterium]|jgi:hypothetical protein|nr:hypothetical protein [Candidatus Acidoferrales bacterium]
MKYGALACGAFFAILVASCTASGQTLASDSNTLSSANIPLSSAPFSVPPQLPLFAMASPAELIPAFEPAFQPASQKDAPASGSGADVPPQGVYGVFPSYRYQIYVGYTFVRFYVVPGVAENTNGLDFSIAYYFRDSLAVDGEMAVSLGSYSGENSEFFMGMGGLRYKHPVGRMDVWIHALAGEGHFSPQTAFGSEDSFGYEVGGGVDVTPRRLRVSWRVQADMVGTHLYGTYQYSPKISIGLVFKD